MKKTQDFEMDILAVFHFKDGRNVFGGMIKNDNCPINRTKVNLVIDGQPQKTIEVDAMLTTPPSPDGRRSVSTYDQVNLTQEFVEKHDCKLVEVEEAIVKEFILV